MHPMDGLNVSPPRRRRITEVMTALEQARITRGLSMSQVAVDLGCDLASLSRIERGRQMPKKPLARRLWRYYGGEVPLGSIYDPLFTPSDRDTSEATNESASS